LVYQNFFFSDIPVLFLDFFPRATGYGLKRIELIFIILVREEITTLKGKRYVSKIW